MSDTEGDETQKKKRRLVTKAYKVIFSIIGTAGAIQLGCHGIYTEIHPCKSGFNQWCCKERGE